jgi:hypothetical protein
MRMSLVEAGDWLAWCQFCKKKYLSLTKDLQACLIYEGKEGVSPGAYGNASCLAFQYYT